MRILSNDKFGEMEMKFAENPRKNGDHSSVLSLGVRSCVFFLFAPNSFRLGNITRLSSSAIVQICVTSQDARSKANHQILIKAIWYLFKFILSLSPSPIYNASFLFFRCQTCNYFANYFVGFIQTAYFLFNYFEASLCVHISHIIN